MRKIVMAVLLTSAAVSPALAQDNGRWHRGQQTEQSGDDRAQSRQERREARQQENAGARSQGAAEFRQRQAQNVEQRQADQGQRGNWDRSRFEGRQNVTQQVQVQQQAELQRGFNRGNRGGYTGAYNGAQTEQVRDAQRSSGWTRDRSNWNQQNTNGWSQQYGQYRQRQAYNGNRTTTWNRDWRNDRRYDWRNYRNSHRSTFRLGIFLDPFGYNYRPFDIGYRLAPAYFGQQYWIDPGMYQLPYPPPGTQWVRYWNDAVLVDMYSGQVVDVIHDFFW